MTERIRAQPRASDEVCPLCKDGLGEDDPHRCPSCGTTYHAACTAEMGGCSTLGCDLRGKRPQQLQHWACRACHQPIRSDLQRRGCRCGAYLHQGCVEAHAEACKHGGELVSRRSRRRPNPVRAAFHSGGVIEHGWRVIKGIAAVGMVVMLLALHFSRMPLARVGWWGQVVMWWGMGGHMLMWFDVVFHLPGKHEAHRPEHNRGTIGFALMLCPLVGGLIYYLLWGRKPAGEV